MVLKGVFLILMSLHTVTVITVGTVITFGLKNMDALEVNEKTVTGFYIEFFIDF